MELIPKNENSFFHWCNNSKIQQKQLSDRLSHSVWDRFYIDKQEHKTFLFQKIAVPLFGNPSKEQDDLGLPEEKKSLVNDILEKCVSHSYDKKEINIGFIFVFVYINKDIQTCVPLIRVMSRTSNQCVEEVQNNVFVDHVGRVYKSFNHYKETNTWDMCYLYVPRFGCYASDMVLDFLDQSSRGKVLKGLDKISTFTNISTSIGLLGGMAMSLFPPTAPLGIGLITASTIAGAPAAAYGVGRSVNCIVDRRLHKQKIGLSDGEARQCWLTAACAVVSVGALSSAKLLANSARAGKEVSAIARAVCTGVSATSISLSGISILNSAYEMSKKKKGELTGLEIFQFCTSVFFFTHSIVSFKTAKAIINEAQHSEITEMKQSLSLEHQEKYDAYLQGIKKNQNEIKGQAKFIRDMKKIGNLNEFYEHFDIHQDGRFLINKELIIPPETFIKLSESDQNQLLALTKQLNEKTININEFTQSTKQIMKDNGIKNRQIRSLGQEYLKKKFNVEKMSDISIGSQKLGNLETHELHKLEKVVRHSFHDGDKDYLKVVDKVTTKQQTKSVDDYCTTGRQISTKIDQEVRNRMRQNSNPERPGGKAKSFYKEQIVQELINNDAKFNQFYDSFPKKIDEPQTAVSTNYLKEKYNAVNLYDVKIGSQTLENLKPHEIQRLEKMVKYSFHDGDKDCMTVVNKMAEKMQIKSSEDYFTIGNHVSKKINQEVISRMRENSNPKRRAGEKAKDFYRKQILNELITDDAKFKEVFDSFTNKIDQPQGDFSQTKLIQKINVKNESDSKAGVEETRGLGLIVRLISYLKDIDAEVWLQLLNKLAGNIEINSFEDFLAAVKRLIDKIEEKMNSRNSEGAGCKKECLYKIVEELANDDTKFMQVSDSFPPDPTLKVSSLKYLKEISNVQNLSDVKFGDLRFRDLEPEDIIRLANFLSILFLKGDEEYLSLISKMAEKMGTKSLDEYFAAGEYIVRKIDLKISDRMKESNKSADAEEKTKNFYKKQIIDELITDDEEFDQIVHSFSRLCKEYYQRNIGGSRFHNAIVAANHYDKLNCSPKVNRNNHLTTKELHDFAQKIIEGPISNIKWTQDGPNLVCSFLSEDLRTMRIIYNISGGVEDVVATLYCDDDVLDLGFISIDHE